MRTQGPLVFDADGVCRTKCYWCGAPVEVPIEIRKDAPVRVERFILGDKG